MKRIYFTIEGVDKRFTFTGKDNEPIELNDEDADSVFKLEARVMKEIQCYPVPFGEVTLHVDKFDVGILSTYFHDVKSKSYPLSGRLKTVLRQCNIIELD